MRTSKFLAILCVFTFCLVLVDPMIAQAAITLTSNASGTYDGFYYELWKDYGNTTMIVDTGGRFSCQWSNIGNALFRTGKKYNNVPWNQVGNVVITYSANYNPNGNSYLCVYGWTRNPLVEFYIVDSWGSWRPPGASPIGTVTIDGGTYEIYRTERINQPSIDGTATFYQYWSVRTSKRTSGTISVTEHFKAWASRGLNLGNLDQITLCVEGYQSSGSAQITQFIYSTGQSPGNDNNTPVVTTIGKVECENMSVSGPYASKISSPFSGVALYANNDKAYYIQSFPGGTYNFSLRGSSNNNNTASVDLMIDGNKVGTFKFSGTTPTVATISNVTVSSGNHTVELVLTTDNGTWDAYIDYLEISTR